MALLSGCSSCKKGDGGGPSGARTTPGRAVTIPAARAAYVTNNASDSISVLDRDGDAVETVTLDLEPDAHEAPHHLALDSAAKTVFVALAFPDPPSKKKDPHAAHGNASDVGRLARLDLATLAIKETRDVDENPGDVIMTHDRGRVLVTHFDMKRAMVVAGRGGASPATMFAHLSMFDARDMRKLGSRAICVAPHGVVTTKDDRTAFVACYGSDELAIVDLSEGGLPTTRVPLGASPGVPGVPRYGPYSATLSPDERKVVVADLDGKDLRVFDRETKRFGDPLSLDAKAFMSTFVEGGALLVPTQAPDGIVRVDLARGKIDKRTSFTRDVCTLPHVVRVAKDLRVYVVCEGDHTAPGTVLEIDPASLAPKRRWTVGVYPDGLAFGDE